MNGFVDCSYTKTFSKNLFDTHTYAPSPKCHSRFLTECHLYTPELLS